MYELLCNDGWVMLHHGSYDSAKGCYPLVYAGEGGIDQTVEISWTQGNDVDICCFWSGAPDMKVGWNYGSEDKTSGRYELHWSGDNTGTGSETVQAVFARGDIKPILVQTLQVYVNRFQNGSGSVTISCGGQSMVLTASNNTGKQAKPGDPGVIIHFNLNGTVKSMSIM